jgi:predicted NBD/HSP70 family sugar kinase
MFKRSAFLVGVAATILVASLAACAQTAAPSVSDQVRDATAPALDQALTYIDSAAKYLGQGVLYLLNLITDNRVSSDLEKPIGYLALITVILILFGLLDVARRIIWIGIVVGWVLLIVRVILDALNL